MTTGLPATACLRDRVLAVLADVLRLPDAHALSDRALFDLPGYDSVAVATVLDRLEDALLVEVPAELVVPEAFETVDSITALFASCPPPPPPGAATAPAEDARTP